MARELDLPEGLTVIRGQIDPALLSDMTTELTQNWEKSKHHGIGVENDNVFFTSGSSYNKVICELGEVTKTVIDQIGLPQVEDTRLVVNRQPAYSAQDFHKDGPPNSVIFHPDGLGAYDFYPLGCSPIDTQACHRVTELEPGDVVINYLSKLLFHRGRNRGPSTRYNLSCFFY